MRMTVISIGQTEQTLLPLREAIIKVGNCKVDIAIRYPCRKCHVSTWKDLETEGEARAKDSRVISI